MGAELRRPVRASRRQGRRPAARKGWFVYILRCADGSLYTGITTDLARRLREHDAGRSRAARYTAGRLPVALAYFEAADGRSTATRREATIRKLGRRAKLALCLGSGVINRSGTERPRGPRARK